MTLVQPTNNSTTHVFLKHYDVLYMKSTGNSKQKMSHSLLRPFFKMTATKSNINNISITSSCRIMILVSNPTFSWARNQIKTFLSVSDHS